MALPLSVSPHERAAPTSVPTSPCSPVTPWQRDYTFSSLGAVLSQNTSEEAIVFLHTAEGGSAQQKAYALRQTDDAGDGASVQDEMPSQSEKGNSEAVIIDNANERAHKDSITDKGHASDLASEHCVEGSASRASGTGIWRERLCNQVQKEEACHELKSEGNQTASRVRNGIAARRNMRSLTLSFVEPVKHPRDVPSRWSASIASASFLPFTATTQTATTSQGVDTGTSASSRSASRRTFSAGLTGASDDIIDSQACETFHHRRSPRTQGAAESPLFEFRVLWGHEGSFSLPQSCLDQIDSLDLVSLCFRAVERSSNTPGRLLSAEEAKDVQLFLVNPKHHLDGDESIRADAEPDLLLIRPWRVSDNLSIQQVLLRQYLRHVCESEGFIQLLCQPSDEAENDVLQPPLARTPEDSAVPVGIPEIAAGREHAMRLPAAEMKSPLTTAKSSPILGQKLAAASDDRHSDVQDEPLSQALSRADVSSTVESRSDRGNSDITAAVPEPIWPSQEVIDQPSVADGTSAVRVAGVRKAYRRNARKYMSLPALPHQAYDDTSCAAQLPPYSPQRVAQCSCDPDVHLTNLQGGESVVPESNDCDEHLRIDQEEGSGSRVKSQSCRLSDIPEGESGCASRTCTPATSDGIDAVEALTSTVDQPLERHFPDTRNSIAVNAREIEMDMAPYESMSPSYESSVEELLDTDDQDSRPGRRSSLRSNLGLSRSASDLSSMMDRQQDHRAEKKQRRSRSRLSILSSRSLDTLTTRLRRRSRSESSLRPEIPKRTSSVSSDADYMPSALEAMIFKHTRTEDGRSRPTTPIVTLTEDEAKALVRGFTPWRPQQRTPPSPQSPAVSPRSSRVLSFAKRPLSSRLVTRVFGAPDPTVRQTQSQPIYSNSKAIISQDKLETLSVRSVRFDDGPCLARSAASKAAIKDNAENHRSSLALQGWHCHPEDSYSATRDNISHLSNNNGVYRRDSSVLRGHQKAVGNPKCHIPTQGAMSLPQVAEQDLDHQARNFRRRHQTSDGVTSNRPSCTLLSPPDRAPPSGPPSSVSLMSEPSPILSHAFEIERRRDVEEQEKSQTSISPSRLWQLSQWTLIEGSED